MARGLFEPAALRSFGIGGALTVAASVFFALTFLPAVLGMLGPRINALGVAGLRDRIRRAFGRPVGEAADRARESRWERMAHWVMARPIAVLIPTLAFLLILGTPFFRLEQGIPDASILPEGIESREASVALAEEFRAGETSPIIVLADVEGSPTDEANIQRILDLAAVGERQVHPERIGATRVVEADFVLAPLDRDLAEVRRERLGQLDGLVGIDDYRLDVDRRVEQERVGR